MIRFDIISAIPDLLKSPLSHSIMQRAIDKGLLNVHIHDLRQYGDGHYKQIDDYQYGGGAGMVLTPGPLDRIISKLKSENSYDEIIYMTPDGERYSQGIANKLSLKNNIIIICGHYKGIDQRIRDIHVTSEISIGDYVLSGGELPAAILVDSIGRLIPGVLNNESSALFDSHQDGLLAPPIYTRPSDFKGYKVPEVLLSGNDKLIEEWRENNSKDIQKT
jgi:tRNA (guanine37-N1)-methyltransferase